MQFPPVNWHEGLFLQPHHFQAWDRHWSERVSKGEQWHSPYSYGILDLAINPDALAAGFFQIDSLRCKTMGGTLIETSTGATLERRDLRHALDCLSSSQSTTASPSNSVNEERRRGQASLHSSCLDIYIGVPRLKLGARNVDPPEHRNGSRFRTQWLDLPDELDAACVKPVELRELNAQVLFHTDDLAGFDVLKIARVRRGESDASIARLDSHYVPPLLDCSSNALLRTQVLSSLYDIVHQCSESIARQLIDRGSGLNGTSSIDMQRLIALQAVNPAAAVLSVMATTRGIHPLNLYLELSRLCGSLDLLQPNRRSQRIDSYDHENLGGILFELKRRIQSSLVELQKSPYQHVAFLGYEHGMSAKLDKSVFQNASRFFIGVHCGECDPGVIQSALTQGQLDWKIGATRTVERLFTARAPGIRIERLQEAPTLFPNPEEWLYFEVLDTGSTLWKDVESTGSLTLRFCDSCIQNREQLPGQRHIDLLFGKARFQLQFALLGVP
ncbi:MAG: type VI secretion system baseplate subunit TssK [Pirellula sp.]|jgi:type VI secretion system protein ImpJ